MYLDWLIGYIEGEGCFTFLVIPYKSKKQRLNFIYQPIFKLSVSAKERSALEEIQAFFGFGRIATKSKKYWIKKSPNARDQVAFIVNGRKLCQQFIEKIPIENFKTSKRISYQNWQNCIEFVRARKHFTYDGFIKLCEMRDIINDRHKIRSYRSAEWFRQFLSDKKLEYFNERSINRRRIGSSAWKY
jgi:hypothetical protein